MVKKIITKTILFIGIVAFVNWLGGIFSANNSLIGVSTVIAALVLLICSPEALTVSWW